MDTIICGLGNPGTKYSNTRHNIGFFLIDNIAKHHNLVWNYNKQFNSEIIKTKISNTSTLLVKPQTFMNESGMAVSKIINYYKINTENLIIIQDDIDLKFASIKCKKSGSSGGHNGIKSIDSQIGNNYFRIRFGIDRPKDQEEVIQYVLKNFNQEELKKIKIFSEKINNFLELILKKNFSDFLNAIKTP